MFATQLGDRKCCKNRSCSRKRDAGNRPFLFKKSLTTRQITAVNTQRPATSGLRSPPVTPLVAGISYTALNQPKSWSWTCQSTNLYTPALTANCDQSGRTWSSAK